MSDADQPGQNQAGQTQARILRLEESQMFSDRAVEQLHEEVLALGGRVAEVLARLQRLEQRVERAEAAAADPAGEGADESEA